MASESIAHEVNIFGILLSPTVNSISTASMGHKQITDLVNGPHLWTWSMDHICGPSPWTSSWIRSIDYPVDHPQFLKMNFTREVLTNFRNLKWTLCCGQVMGSLYFTLFFYTTTLYFIFTYKGKIPKIVENLRKKVAKLQFTQ